MLRTFIWGTGHFANWVLNNYEIFEKYDVIGFIDNDLNKQGGKYYEKNIYAPEILLKIKADKILILVVECKEIYLQISNKLNLKEVEIEDWSFFYKQIKVKPQLLNRYKETKDPEIKEIIEYVALNDLEPFNYCFREKYKHLDISVLYDKNCKMFYVLHKGKKMYFSRKLATRMEVLVYYRSILIEQDEMSPHKYLDDGFNVCHGDVVIDVGVAEGNFALEIIDRVSKIYLIETDEMWIEALKETFKAYQDKVVIIKKFITSHNDGNCSTLDRLIKEPVDFMKMDIEGNERNAILAAKNLIKISKKIKCAICSYHLENDETIIKTLLEKYGLKCSTTRGYMWFPSRGSNGEMSTKLCRGIVRGIR